MMSPTEMAVLYTPAPLSTGIPGTRRRGLDAAKGVQRNLSSSPSITRQVSRPVA
jgi:hypothetical protein